MALLIQLIELTIGKLYILIINNQAVQKFAVCQFVGRALNFGGWLFHKAVLLSMDSAMAVACKYSIRGGAGKGNRREPGREEL